MKKINQIKIAEKAGLDNSFISKVLSGKANPSLKSLYKISKAMGISIHTLIKKIERCTYPGNRPLIDFKPDHKDRTAQARE